MTNKLPSLTTLVELRESVEKIIKLHNEYLLDPKAAHDLHTEMTIKVLHQVILETVEVVGKEIIGEEIGVGSHVDPQTHWLAANERHLGYNDAIEDMRARLSQLMDSLKEEK